MLLMLLIILQAGCTPPSEQNQSDDGFKSPLQPFEEGKADGVGNCTTEIFDLPHFFPANSNRDLAVGSDGRIHVAYVKDKHAHIATRTPDTTTWADQAIDSLQALSTFNISVAVDDDGTIYALYSAGDRLRLASKRTTGTWTFRSLTSCGGNSRMDVRVGYVNILCDRAIPGAGSWGSHPTFIQIRPNGTSWSEVISSEETADISSVQASSDGTVHASWRGFNAGARYAMRSADGSWSVDSIDGRWLEVAGDKDGGIHRVWQSISTPNLLTYYDYRDASGPFSDKVIIDIDGVGERTTLGNRSSPRISVSPKGSVFITFWDEDNAKFVLRPPLFRPTDTGGLLIEGRPHPGFGGEDYWTINSALAVFRENAYSSVGSSIVAVSCGD